MCTRFFVIQCHLNILHGDNGVAASLIQNRIQTPNIYYSFSATGDIGILSSLSTSIGLSNTTDVVLPVLLVGLQTPIML